MIYEIACIDGKKASDVTETFKRHDDDHVRKMYLAMKGARR